MCLMSVVCLSVETFVAMKSPNEAYNKFLVKCDFLHRAAHQLGFVDEANQGVWQNNQNQLQPLQEQVERIYGGAQLWV